jgi:anti-anti-sigma factor
VSKIGSGVFNVSPKGSIDSDTYIILQKKMDEIMKPTPRFIIFDMKGVEYISSMGIKVVLNAKNSVETSGGLLLLLNLRPQINKVFDIIKAIPASHIFANREELDSYLADVQQKESDNRKGA